MKSGGHGDTGRQRIVPLPWSPLPPDVRRDAGRGARYEWSVVPRAGTLGRLREIPMAVSFDISRRDLIKSGVGALAAVRATEIPATPAHAEQVIDPASASDSWHGLKVSVASYTLRKVNIETAIKDINRT